MKKQSIFTVLATAIISSSILMSCIKNDNPEPLPAKVQKIMYDWKITNITTPKKNNPNTDSVLLKDCMGDDIIRFSINGFDFQDGTAKCDSTVFYYSKGNWAYKLDSDSIQLGATQPLKYMSWKVVSVTDSVMQVKYIDSTDVANKITKTISLKH